MTSGIFTKTQVNYAISQGTGAWSDFTPPKQVEYLVVAGGGAATYISGAGAGGLLQGVVPVTPATSYSVTVGAGGTSSGGTPTNGNNSVFSSITAIGGGTNGASGGSAGGSAQNSPSVQGIAGQGNAGAAGAWADNTGSGEDGGGGGGGAGTPGRPGAPDLYGGNGGAGIVSDITGYRIAYAGGGGGTLQNAAAGTPGTGGVGGGGNGYTNTTGAANTGGGAGAPGFGGDANGGSGIVVVRYPGRVQFYSGGEISYANGHVVHVFKSSGTLAPLAAPVLMADSDYQIARSLRLNSADSAYLSRTPAGASNRKTWTWSGWVKLSKFDINQYGLFSSRSGSDNTRFASGLASDNTFTISNINAANSTNLSVTTTQVFRDPSAWYHIVMALDTTQAVSTERIKLYINGVRVTAFASSPTYPSLNEDLGINTTIEHNIGKYALTGNFVDGYMAEINFVDGQALTPNSFGFVNPNTGVWSPIRYRGTYGTNGFYLNFSDNSNTTAATLGKDNSGNGLNWTPNNFSVTAGAGNDSLVDSPTAYGTDTGVGGEVRGNYCTLNPLAKNTNTALANGNLDISSATPSTAVWYPASSTIKIPTSGKWYFEAIVGATDSSAYRNYFGIITDSFPITTTTGIGNNAQGWAYFADTGQVYNNTTVIATLTSSVTNDVIGVAFNADAGELRFYKNGSAMGTSALTGFTSSYFFAVSVYGTATAVVNFGQRPFAYTAPSGFKALCTQNLPTPTIGATKDTLANKYFDVVLRNAVGSVGSVVSTSVNMSNGAMIWDKPRISANHYIVDSVRGLNKLLRVNAINAEETDATWFTNFGNGTFTLGATDWGTNTSVVDWIWAANGSGVSNTSGSITSTVSANQTSGFSIVTWTGNSTNATIGHGLGTAPKFFVIRYRGTTDNWYGYHASTGANNYLTLNSDAVAQTSTSIWQNTAPTSSVFSIGLGNNQSTIVAYCFAEVPGYSQFGSYTGNGSSAGPFVFTGFKPAFVLIKRTDAIQNWLLHDNKRNTANAVNNYLMANSNEAAADYAPSQIDFLSNGFKLLGTAAGMNASSGNYIYMAFAESPFKYALAR